MIRRMTAVRKQATTREYCRIIIFPTSA